ncbi:hypothetical protein LXA43DRAFT_899486 [Ganoderma leucocontextum]|nr:hypothetical protein LXA43DRAFT_899486 [Ganoderma leucocontextum]
MSTAQVTFDDYAIPSPGSPQTYELSCLGISRPSSLYPHGHLDASLSGSRLSGQVSHIPAGPTHTFLGQQPHLLMQYHVPGVPGPFIDLNAPYPSNGQPSSSRDLYAATSGWTDVDAYGGFYDPSSSAAFLHNLQSVIESSHTAQTQQQNTANIASSAQPSGAAQSSWTGSIDFTTGVFQRSVEHPRLRTAQACEKCRIRKAKCSGETPCKRCLDKGLQCEYAPERKMRGPNKNKRRAALHQKRSTASPTSDRAIPDSVSTPASSEGSDGAVSDHQRSESSPSTLASYTLDISSSQSSLAAARHAAPEASRPRSATVGRNPSGSSCDVLDAFGDVRATFSKRRPPRLDLTEAREMYPRLLAEYARNTDQVPFPVPIETSIDTRTSLPTYLAQSYSRIALHNSEVAPGLPASLDMDSRYVPPRSLLSSVPPLRLTDVADVLQPCLARRRRLPAPAPAPAARHRHPVVIPPDRRARSVELA